MLLPALADGQIGFVLDAKIVSKQWFKEMPTASQPLPMLEPAIVCGVSDAVLLKKALGEYRAIFNDAIAKVRELVPNLEIPDWVKIPEPETRKTKDGTIYSYQLPATWGVDKQIAPNLALSDKVMVTSISPDQSQRLLAGTPLKVKSGPLADLKQPLAAAAYFNWPALVDAVGPWVEYGFTQYATLSGQQPAALNETLKQVRTVMDVLKVFRGISSVTYFEDKVLVTHTVTVIEDLPK